MRERKERLMREPVKTNKCENMRGNVVTRITQYDKEIILICTFIIY